MADGLTPEQISRAFLDAMREYNSGGNLPGAGGAGGAGGASGGASGSPGGIGGVFPSSFSSLIEIPPSQCVG